MSTPTPIHSNNHDNAENQRTVFSTIMAVQSELAKVGISKNQKNTQQGWKFRGIDDVLNALSGVLAEKKCLIMPNVISKKRLDVAKGHHWLVTVDWTFFDDQGDFHTSRHCGEAIDYGDKGLAKAITASYKYFLFNALCIPLLAQEFGDADYEDPESDEKKPKLKAVKKIPKKEKTELEKAHDELQKAIGYKAGAGASEEAIEVSLEELRKQLKIVTDKYPNCKKQLHAFGLAYSKIKNGTNNPRATNATTKPKAS